MKSTLDELLVFTSIVDTGSITAAADVMNLTVSATSRLLSRLEGKLQTTLLRRTTRRIELTEEGAIFLQHARHIVASVTEAEEQLAIRRIRPVGTLRVDAASSFMLHVLVPLLDGFHQEYPEIKLELSSNEGIMDLLEKRIDIAFRIGELKDSTLHAKPIGVSRRRILASPAYLKKHGVPTTAEQLKQHKLLGFTQPEHLNHWPLAGASNGLLGIEPYIEATSGEVIKQMALNGLGIACLSDFMTHMDIQQKRLIPLFSEQSLDVRQSINAVYYRNTALTQRISCFVEYVKAALGDQAFSYATL